MDIYQFHGLYNKVYSQPSIIFNSEILRLMCLDIEGHRDINQREFYRPYYIEEFDFFISISTHGYEAYNWYSFHAIPYMTYPEFLFYAK